MDEMQIKGMPSRFDAELDELIRSMKASGYLKSASIEAALRNAPRHLFLPRKMADMAYRDCPLSIGHGQTISQPSTVVVMTETLQAKPEQRILEIGGGSGWQAALLGRIVGPKGKVYTIERIEELVKMAKNNLRAVGIRNVRVVHGDGSGGLPKQAPYDRIIVTAACPAVPPHLIAQLKMKGRLIVPVGDLYTQIMTVITKTAKDTFEKEEIGRFMFVPLIGRYGFKQA